MKARDFHIWMQMLPQLSEAQRKVVRQTLSNPVETPRIEALLNQRSAEVLYCPHCMTRQVQRWGKPFEDLALVIQVSADCISLRSHQRLHQTFVMKSTLMTSVKKLLGHYNSLP